MIQKMKGELRLYCEFIRELLMYVIIWQSKYVDF